MDEQVGINSVQGRELFLHASGIVCNYCPGEIQGLCETCALRKVLGELKPLPKKRMLLTWHNCKICPPSEEHNDDLILWDGATLIYAEWNKGFWYCGGVYLDMTGGEEECWWADLHQTTSAFFEEE